MFKDIFKKTIRFYLKYENLFVYGGDKIPFLIIFSANIQTFFNICKFSLKNLLNITTFLKLTDIYCYTITINHT